MPSKPVLSDADKKAIRKKSEELCEECRIAQGYKKQVLNIYVTKQLCLYITHFLLSPPQNHARINKKRKQAIHMILTGNEIKKNIGKNIIITPYDESQVNPNSYNLKLSNEIAVYEDEILDPKKENKVQNMIIPDEGFILEPGKLYLAKTLEYTETYNYVPILFGRSSMGRLGLGIHVTAGFGDVGFCGYWTLQLTCLQRVKIYPYMKICQIVYFSVQGETENYISDKYQNSDRIMASQIYKEM